MSNQGYIALHRKILDWEWYSDLNVRILFFHLLLKVNFQEKKWQGKTIQAGELITSIVNLASETCLTVKQIRAALNKLKNTGEVAIKGTNKFTSIKLVNYRLYQVKPTQEGKQKDDQRANEGQTRGKRGANKGRQLKNDNNDNNEKNVINIPDWMNLEDWNDFVQHRIDLHKADKRSPILTKTSAKKMINTLVKLEQDQTGAAKEAMNISIINGWKGVFPPKATKQTKTSGTDELLNDFINEK